MWQAQVPRVHLVLVVLVCAGSPVADPADDPLKHQAESQNSLQLNTAAAQAAQEKREDDAAFLFLVGQARFQIDAKVYPPLRKGGDSPATLIGALAAVMSRPALEPVIRDPERMQRLIGRVEKWSPQFAGYDPGYEYKSKLAAEEQTAIVKEVVTQLLTPLRAEAKLLQNPEYAAVSREIEKWQAAIDLRNHEWDRRSGRQPESPVPPEIVEAARVARVNQDAALLRRQAIVWKLLPETRFHQKHGWVAENYFDDPQVIALCRAIEDDDLPKMRQLIEAGANVKAIGKQGMTLLLWAYPDNKFERFELLLQHGADPNVYFESDFPSRDRRVFHPLPSGHGGLNDWGCAGRTITHKAAAAPYVKYLVAVMAHGGDAKLEVKETGEKPLNIAIGEHRDRLQRVKLLVAAGADPYHELRSGHSAPLEVAIHRKLDDTAEYLWKECRVNPKKLPYRRQELLVDSIMGRYFDGYSAEDKFFQELLLWTMANYPEQAWNSMRSIYASEAFREGKHTYRPHFRASRKGHPPTDAAVQEVLDKVGATKVPATPTAAPPL